MWVMTSAEALGYSQLVPPGHGITRIPERKLSDFFVKRAGGENRSLAFEDFRCLDDGIASFG